MYNSYGGDLPATVFRKVMGYALQGKEYRDFPAYSPSGEAKDIVKTGEKPASPSPTPSPTDSPTPEAEETPVAEETPDVVSTPQPAEDGRSYLLPETLDPELPDLSPSKVDPISIVTPAPLPDSFSPQGGTERGGGQIPQDSPDLSAPPLPGEVKLPPVESE